MLANPTRATRAGLGDWRDVKVTGGGRVRTRCPPEDTVTRQYEGLPTRSREKVDPNHTTETFVAVRLAATNLAEGKEGVPILDPDAGKCMSVTATEVSIRLQTRTADAVVEHRSVRQVRDSLHATRVWPETAVAYPGGQKKESRRRNESDVEGPDSPGSTA